MSLENYYLKLPDFIKFNPRILKLSFRVSNFITQFRGISPQSYFSELSSKDENYRRIHSKFKLLYVELLIFLDNVCMKHGIDYWLGSGTLLGAVRHEGFVPWDDDIDLSLLRNDFKKLIDVLPEELSKYGLQEYCGLTLLLEDKKNYFEGFNSLIDVKDVNGNSMIDSKYNFMQFFLLKPFIKIDLFPLDFITEGSAKNIYDRFTSVQYKFNYQLLKNKVRYFDEIDSLRYEMGFTDEKTRQFSEAFECLPHGGIRIFDYGKTFPLESISFEGHEFKCPKDCDHHLNVMFGPNYMQYPKSIQNHDTLELIERQFNSREEMETFFDKSIELFKKINENFDV